MIRLYLVRHGETEYNRKGVYYGRTDCLLSDYGVWQAEKLKNILFPVQFDRVISSPLQRSMQTAKRIIGEKQLQIQQIEGFAEFDFGAWEGKHYQEIEADDPENWQSWINDWKYAQVPDGDSFMIFYNRVKSSLAQIFAGGLDETILIVAHQGTLRVIAAELMGMKEEGYWNFCFEQGTYSLLELVDGHCTIKKINATE